MNSRDLPAIGPGCGVSTGWNGAGSSYHVQLKKILSAITARAQSGSLASEPEFIQRDLAYLSSLVQAGWTSICASDQQPTRSSDCRTASDDLSKFVKAGDPDLIAASRYTLPDSLTLSNETINPNRPVLTLAPDVAPSDRLDAVRFALSINSCAGCHGVETDTRFHHVGMRPPGSRSCLSAFLTGVGGACGDNVSTGYETIGPLSPAEGCNVKLEKREFNDLLRRHLFLHGVQSLETTSSDHEWRETLDKSGLTAPQSH